MVRHLPFALRLGEPMRVGRALLTEAAYLTFGGSRTRKRCLALLERADEVLAGRPDPFLVVFRGWIDGMGLFLLGRWNEAAPVLVRADEAFRALGRGNAWERHVASFFLLRVLECTGRYGDLARRLPEFVAEAEDRGDRFAHTDLRVRLGHLPFLRQDDVEGARAETESALSGWSRSGFLLQHYYALLARLDTHMYARDAAGAWRLLAEEWPSFRRSLLMRIQLSRVHGQIGRGRAAAALAAESSPAEARRLRREAARHARAAAGESLDYAVGWARLIEAAVAAQEGDRARSLALLDEAEARVLRCGMAGYAAAIERRRGEMVGGPEGRARVAASEAALRAEGAARPDRIADMLAPGFPPVPRGPDPNAT
jgi:hypothetical protein